MKKLILMSCLLPVLSITSCENDDDNNCQGIDCLPSTTQTGEGTFGCLVNGEPFVDNSGAFNCFYQFINGEYYFGISAVQEDIIPSLIILNTEALPINENESYDLIDEVEGDAHARVVFYRVGNTNTTNQNFSGTLFINHIDFNNNTVSGTFNFNIQDTLTGDIYEITEGRFDAQFTQ